MITKGDKIAFGIIVVLTFLIIMFRKDVTSVFAGKKAVAHVNIKEDTTGKQKGTKDKKNKKNKKDKDGKKEIDRKTDSNITIAKKWDLPSELKEISGIAYINDNRFACVQDELGKIFIFNTDQDHIEKQIPFAQAGDYEGIAIVGTTAYIIRADGKLFEVVDYNGNNPSIVLHSTHLTQKQDVEGLCYDKKNNRLLLGIKGKDQSSNDYKGIYAFDLSSKKLLPSPVYKIDLTHNIWTEAGEKNKVEPSDLGVHPITGNIYLIDNAGPRLLIMGADGTKENVYQLSSLEFPQPEGISFTPQGDIFISNEGKTGSGTILKVSIGM